MSEAQSAETSEHAIRLLFSQGIASPDVQDLLDLDFDPETSLTPLTQVRWTSQAEVKSISPDCNDTYSALDDHFAGVHVSRRTRVGNLRKVYLLIQSVFSSMLLS